MVIRGKETICVFRNIISEIRRANPKVQSVAKSPTVQFLLNEYRCHQVTEKRTCKGEHTLNYMAKTYLVYLQSLRKYNILFKQYYGRGERSVEETAKIVGFSLPKQGDSKNKKD